MQFMHEVGHLIFFMQIGQVEIRFHCERPLVVLFREG